MTRQTPKKLNPIFSQVTNKCLGIGFRAFKAASYKFALGLEVQVGWQTMEANFILAHLVLLPSVF